MNNMETSIFRSFLRPTILFKPHIFSSRIPVKFLTKSMKQLRKITGTGNLFQGEKKLFTPGPLGVSATTKEAMLRDVGSRDIEFIQLIKYIRRQLLIIAGVSTNSYTAIPLQGSGTYAVEAVLLTSTPLANGRVLILENGAYGKRMKKICELANLKHEILSFNENEQVDVGKVETILKHDANFTTVSIVHCETSSGVINPIEKIGQLVKRYTTDTAYFVDAMSSFGAIPIDMETSHIDYLVSSANKCIQGVPGFSYAIARLDHLLNCKGNCHSLSLDLVDQHLALEANGQFRFTPPTHAMLAFNQALIEFNHEGGVKGRAIRYQENRLVIRDGMRKLGFKELLDDSHKGYIITSFHFPKDNNFKFEEFYNRLNEMGQVIYPGKVTNADCFRIGNIGHLFPEDMKHLLSCIEIVCQQMNIKLPVK